MQITLSSGRVENRVPLHSVVPLNAPFTIGLSPSELCNFKCSYCNWGTNVGIPKATIMPWEDFVNIAEQIKKLYDKAKVKCKNFRFNGNGEPLLNSRLAEMVKYIKNLNFTERIEITSNASLLTHELSKNLINGGLTRLVVSLQGLNGEQYYKICGKKIDFDNFLEELKYFYTTAKASNTGCDVHIKILDVALKPEEHQTFYDMFKNSCDTMGIENVMDAYDEVNYEELFPQYNRERTRYAKEFVERKCCDTLFFLATILPDGDVNVCGCKWPPRVIGNVFEKQLTEIWNTGQHKEDMITHLKGLRGTLSDCKDCLSMVQYVMPEDNLDDHVNEILQRLLMND